jgi:hypothetical protein
MSSLFRVDKFIVPDAARAEFIRAIRMSHDLIGRQPGCLQHHILEQVDGPGESNFASIVEWSGPDTMDAARKVISGSQMAAGIDPQVFRARNGILADTGTYSSIGVA